MQLVFAIMSPFSLLCSAFSLIFTEHLCNSLYADQWESEEHPHRLGECHGNEGSAPLPPATPGGRGPPSETPLPNGSHAPQKRFPNMLVSRVKSSSQWKKKVLNLNWFIISIIPIKKIKIHGAAFYKCKKTSNPSKRPMWRIIHHFNNLMWDEWQPIIHSSWKKDSNSTFTGRLESLPLLSHLNSLGRSWAGSGPTQWCSKDFLPMTILAETQEPCGPSEQWFLLGVQDLCQHTQQL